jgi:hypothetical protein
MFTKPLKDKLLKRIFDASKVMMLMAISAVPSLAQENPWATQKGSNPWGKSEEPKKEKDLFVSDSARTHLQIDTVKVEPMTLTLNQVKTIEGTHEMDLVYDEKFKSYFYKVPKTNYYAYSTEIQDTIFLYSDEGKILILDRNNKATLQHLEDYAKVQHKAPMAFVGSFLCSTILNVFSIPLNLISLAIPSYGKERFTSDYVKDNKAATSSERKSIRKGIQKKRTQNTGVGTVCGIFLSSIFWYNLFN